MKNNLQQPAYRDALDQLSFVKKKSPSVEDRLK